MCEEGSKWVSDFLNSPTKTGGKKLNSGKTKPSRYALCRSRPDGMLKIQDYPNEFPLIRKAKEVADYFKRFHLQGKRFADFAPLLIVSEASARNLGDRCDMDETVTTTSTTVGAYPTRSFRGNIVVDGSALPAWDEENWWRIRVGGFELWKIKECPRCTVPCRDQESGEFLFKGKDMLKLWKVLKEAFPRKYADPEWGHWAGAFFGVYYGYDPVLAEKEGARLRVGDEVEVEERRPWDDYARAERQRFWTTVAVAMAVVAIALAYVVYAAGVVPGDIFATG